MTYDECLPLILRYEGGYTVDSGGPTNKGITEEVYDKYLFKKGLSRRSIRLISDAEVSEIYKKQYWNEGGCDGIPEDIRLSHFDFCVNSGIDQAKKTLQGVAGVTRDGIIGVKTLYALNQIKPLDLLENYTNARLEFYNGLVERKPKIYAKYLTSWTKRTLDCKKRTLEDIGRRDSDIRPCTVSGTSSV